MEWWVATLGVVYGWFGGAIFGAVVWNERGLASHPWHTWVALAILTAVWPLDVAVTAFLALKAYLGKGESENGPQEEYEERVAMTAKRIEENFEGVEHVETLEEARARVLRGRLN